MSGETLKKDILWLGVFFIAFLVIARIVFFRESWLVTTKLMLALFIMAVAPGFGLTYCIKDLAWIERFVIGTILMFAIIGVGSAVLGFFRVHFGISTVLLVVICYIASIFFILKTNKKKAKEAK